MLPTRCPVKVSGTAVSYASDSMVVYAYADCANQRERLGGAKKSMNQVIIKFQFDVKESRMVLFTWAFLKPGF